jgi:tetratricopeptide (TPR) repeat protein
MDRSATARLRLPSGELQWISDDDLACSALLHAAVVPSGLSSAAGGKLMRHTTAVVLQRLLVAVGLLATPLHAARAQPPDAATLQAAKSYVEAGLAAQDRRDYDTAIVFYGKAYELVPHPTLLFNIAQSHRLAGRMDKAEEFYRRFLMEGPMDSEAQLARDFLEEIVRQRSDRDRRAQEAREAPSTTETNRSAPDAPASRAARQATVPATSGAHPADPGWSPAHQLALSTAAVSVLALSAAAALGASATARQHNAHDLCPAVETRCDAAEQANALIRSAHDRALAADVAFGVAAAAAVTTSILWIAGARDSTRLVVAAPDATSGRVVVAMRGSF